jgi:hypothetical protein
MKSEEIKELFARFETAAVGSHFPDVRKTIALGKCSPKKNTNTVTMQNTD